MSARTDGASTLRTRWSAIGAAVAVALGGGGILGATAAGTDGGSQSAFTAIAPCRIMDTRATSTVGPRPVALGAAETHSITTFGTNGNCTLPNGLTALSLNVTAVGPTADSYLTVFPAGGTVPTASNLNFVANQPPVPNAVTVAVPSDGRISFYNNGGNVNVIADVVGYYTKSAGAAKLPLVFSDYAAGRYVFTSVGCGPRGLRLVVERAWGAPGVFSDSPCIDAPVWDNTTEQGIELLRWQAPLGSLPVGVNQYRTENAVPFNLTIPMVPPSTIVNVFCSIIEQGSPLVRCDASPFTFMLTYPYDTLPVFQALTGYTPGTFTMLSENPPNP